MQGGGGQGRQLALGRPPGGTCRAAASTVGSTSQQQPQSVFAASDEVDEVGFVISGISTMLGT